MKYRYKENLPYNTGHGFSIAPGAIFNVDPQHILHNVCFYFDTSLTSVPVNWNSPTMALSFLEPYFDCLEFFDAL